MRGGCALAQGGIGWFPWPPTSGNSAMQADEVDVLLQLMARQVVGFEHACREQLEAVEALYNEVGMIDAMGRAEARGTGERLLPSGTHAGLGSFCSRQVILIKLRSQGKASEPGIRAHHHPSPIPSNKQLQRA